MASDGLKWFLMVNGWLMDGERKLAMFFRFSVGTWNGSWMGMATCVGRIWMNLDGKMTRWWRYEGVEQTAPTTSKTGIHNVPVNPGDMQISLTIH